MERQVQALLSQKLSEARKKVAGSPAAAISGYKEVLAIDPGNIEALRFLAFDALQRGDSANAVECLRNALDVNKTSAQLWCDLGLVQQMQGDLVGSAQSMQQALILEPDFFIARLHLGTVQEQQGQRFNALTSYFRAIAAAQSRGLWVDEASTPIQLRRKLGRAMRFLARFREQVLSETMLMLSQQYGADEMRRVEQFLAILLEKMAPDYPDPRQRPKALYFPGLPPRAFFANLQFPWLPHLEAKFPAILNELHGLLDSNAPFEPFLKLSPEAVVDEYLRSTRNTPAWDAFFFFRHGRPFEANQQSCPDTAAILETLPLVRIDGEAPEILFSVLAPGTRIMPHHGVTNSRSVVHLPLIIPPDCALRVGGETHVWWPGQGVVFDDTYEHEAWNESGQVRVVLIVDTWNPYLTQAEQSALAALVPVNASVDRALRAQ